MSFTFCVNLDHSSLRCNFCTVNQCCPRLSAFVVVFITICYFADICYVMMSKVNASIWSAMCSVYRVCILSLIVVISCTNLHHWNNCLYWQHSVYYDVFYCLCRFWKLPNVFFFCMRYSLSCPFQCLNFLRKFTQLEYLLLFRNLLISNAYVADSVLSTCHMFFYCPRVLQDIHFSCLLSFHCLHFLHRFTLSEYFAVFINLFIAICCMQHIHYALLFFYRQHHFW